MPITTGEGTTHAEPRRAARLMESATSSLVGVRNAARCFRSVTGVRRPACELMGRESSKTTRKSQTYFHHSRARGRESSNYVDAARGRMDAKIAARRPARRAKVSIPLQPTTAGNALACVCECDEPVRADENVPSRQNGLLGGRFQEMIDPVTYYYPWGNTRRIPKGVPEGFETGFGHYVGKYPGAHPGIPPFHPYLRDQGVTRG